MAYSSFLSLESSARMKISKISRPTLPTLHYITLHVKDINITNIANITFKVDTEAQFNSCPKPIVFSLAVVSLDWVRKWYINVLDLLDPVSVCKVYDEVYDPKTSDRREFMYDEWLFVRQDWRFFSSGLTMDRWPQLRFMFYKVGVSLQVSNPKIVFLIQLRWLFKSFKRRVLPFHLGKS